MEEKDERNQSPSSQSSHAPPPILLLTPHLLPSSSRALWCLGLHGHRRPPTWTPLRTSLRWAPRLSPTLLDLPSGAPVARLSGLPRPAPLRLSATLQIINNTPLTSVCSSTLLRQHSNDMRSNSLHKTGFLIRDQMGLYLECPLFFTCRELIK